MAQPAPLAGSGLVTKSSPWTVEETVARFTALLTARGMTVFAVIDHRARPAASASSCATPKS